MSDALDRFYEVLTARPILQTARFALRMPVQKDIPALIAMLDDFEMASKLARIPHPYTEADARFFLDAIVPGELVWAITEPSADTLVGVVGLAVLEQDLGTIEIGYYVARSHWGAGIATEAAAAVLAFGVNLVGREKLLAGHFVDNPSSGRVLSKLGFVETHTAQRHCLATDELKPSVEMRLT